MRGCTHARAFLRRITLVSVVTCCYPTDTMRIGFPYARDLMHDAAGGLGAHPAIRNGASTSGSFSRPAEALSDIAPVRFPVSGAAWHYRVPMLCAP